MINEKNNKNIVSKIARKVKSVKPNIIEQTFAYLLGEGYEKPVTEHRFDAVRKWRFDYAFLDAKVAVEVEGGAFTRGRHTRGVGFINDMQKYNAAVLQGWRILRITPDGLNTVEFVAMVKQLLKQ